MVILFEYCLVYKISLYLAFSLDENRPFGDEEDGVCFLPHSKNLRLWLYKLYLEILNRLVYKLITLNLRSRYYSLKNAIFDYHLMEYMNSN